MEPSAPVVLAEIDGLAADLAAIYDRLKPSAQARVLMLAHSLGRLRQRLVSQLSPLNSQPQGNAA